MRSSSVRLARRRFASGCDASGDCDACAAAATPDEEVTPPPPPPPPDASGLASARTCEPDVWLREKEEKKRVRVSDVENGAAQLCAHADAPRATVRIPVLDGEGARGLVADGDGVAARLADDAPAGVLVRLGRVGLGLDGGGDGGLGPHVVVVALAVVVRGDARGGLFAFLRETGGARSVSAMRSRGGLNRRAAGYLG